MRNVLMCIVLLSLIFSLGAQPIAESRSKSLSLEQRTLYYTEAVQDFSDALFSSNPKREDNIMISPLSALLALGMTANGANGPTQNQMLSVLAGSRLSLADFNAANQAYLKAISEDENTPLLIANSLWANELIPFEKAFLSTVEKGYQAKATNLDFSTNKSVETINNWVKDATRGTIDSIIDSIEPNTILYLINAISFKDDWLSEFEKNLSRERAFHAKDETLTATFLHKEASFLYASIEDGEMIFLPYKHPDYMMVAVLPEKGLSIDHWLEGRRQDSLSRFLIEKLDSAQMEYLSLALPKFESRYQDSFVDNLQRMGMTYAFDASRSDFSAMISQGGRQVVIDDVLHKSYIRVDEKGTEAAAVTAVVMRLTSIAPRPARSLVFDRPFFYAIIDRERQIALFMGVLDRP